MPDFNLLNQKDVVIGQVGQTCQDIKATLDTWWAERGHWQYVTTNVRDTIVVWMIFEFANMLMIEYSHKIKNEKFQRFCEVYVHDVMPRWRLVLGVLMIYFLYTMPQ